MQLTHRCSSRFLVNVVTLGELVNRANRARIISRRASGFFYWSDSMKKIILALLLMLVAVCNCAFAMSVKVLNVGQGDAILIQTSEQNVLIDTSDVDERDKLRTELYKADCYRLDKIVLTHPHADHIGNAAWLIQDGVFQVHSIYDNGKTSTNKYYLNYLNACKKYSVPRYTAHAGDIIELGDGATFTVLASASGVKNVNDDSIVGKLTYGNFAMMFTGDAEFPVEDFLRDENLDLSAVAMKAGHHGSRTSNSFDFVKDISPTYVFISAGEPTTKRGGNTYGHPHIQPLENFLMVGVRPANIFWTYRNGTITIETDGNNVTVTPEIVDIWVDEYLGYRLTVRQIA